MVEHTPMVALYDGEGHRRKLIGYVCGHCDGIWTPGMELSRPQRYVETNPGFQGRFVKNSAHARRVRAAKKVPKKAKVAAGAA